MKINWRKLFSLSVSDSEYLNDNKVKIEYTGCNFSKKSCLNYLPEINKYFHKSDIFYRDKEFDRSLGSLEKAYNIAGEIKEPVCLQCAMFFQATVIQSIENIHSELENMSKGIFATRRYQASFARATELLKNAKSEKEITPTYSSITNASTLEPACM